MTVAMSSDGTIRLEGICADADAEPLLRLLVEHRDAAIDWRGCTGAHSAIIQVLLAAGVNPLGPPANAFLRDHVAPLFGAIAASGGTDPVRK